jgi:transcriptional regulator with XRE-family HTH domain
MATVYIGKKLDFLMKLTGVTNNELAKALNFDSSHISRIRSGQRGLPKQRSFLEPAAEFFARKIREPYQIKGAQDVVCPGRAWPGRPAARAALIARWLSEENVDRPFFSEPNEGGGKTPAAREKTVSTTGIFFDSPAPFRTANVFYYGNEGKRTSALRFLNEVIERPDAPGLLLYSDEDMSWLTEDPYFTKEWMERMIQVLKKGCSVTMVHSVSRSVGEMLSAIRSWMPLYLAGRIDPWFCPKLRDGVFCQTRFIASCTAAILGGSMGNDPGNSNSIYIEDPEMIRRQEAAFRSFLNDCRPLMRIYREGNRETLREDVDQFEEMRESCRAVCDPRLGSLFVKESAALLFSPPEARTVFAIKERALVAGLGELVSRDGACSDGEAAELLRSCREAFGIGNA